jgi:glycosyltransferase involved in cell wall biosynthesis
VVVTLISRSATHHSRCVCFPFVGDTLGGSHLSSIELIREMQKSGTNILVVLHQKGPLETELLRQKMPFEVVPVNGIFRQLPRNAIDTAKMLQTIIRLVIFCHQRNVRVIHTNDGRIHVTWGLVSILLRRKHVWHQRTVLGPSRSVEWVLGRVSKVICISRFVEQSLPAELLARSMVVPNPIGDLSVLSEEVKQARSCLTMSYRHPEEVSIIGVFGNLTPVKDPLTGVLALAIYRKRTGKRALLCYFGKDRESYQEKILRSARENQISDSVALIDFRRPIAKWMSACDVVLAPSICDAFGRTILEAMALGVPVIAASAGGHQELICDGYNGLLVEPQSPEAFAQAMAEVLQTPDLRSALVRNGKTYVRERYEDGAIVQSILRMYRSL